jgi:hypothetical protein
MAGIFQFGGNLYDINDLRVFISLNDGTFGGMVDVPAVDMFRMEFVMKSQRANGDGGIAALASAVEAINVNMRNVGISRDHWAVMFPSSSYEYGSTPNRVEDFFIEVGTPNPYFGALAQIFDGESQSSGAIIFIPRIKIMNNVQWQAEYNTFVTPELQGMAVPDTNLINPSGRPRLFHAKYYESGLPSLDSVTLPLPMGS